jgi:HD-GYP domain-containing protein (c-di-GMP phosphodiesterase class II)
MTSERTYSGAIAPEEALAELRACAGTQFDPTVVAAFVQTLEESGFQPREKAPAEPPVQPRSSASALS